MKKLIPLLVLVAVLAGCGNVAQQLQDQRHAFDLALDTQHQFRAAGLISAKEVAAVLPYEKAIQAALDAGQLAASNGDSSTARTYYDAVLAGMTKYVAVQPTPATKPVSR